MVLCDSEYDKFTGSGLVGKQVSFVPKQTLALSAIYQLETVLRTNRNKDHRRHAVLGLCMELTQLTRSRVTHLLDANLGYDWNSWEFSVFGVNLTDEEYYTSLVNNLTGTPGIAGSPRVIGLSISKEF